LFWNLKSLNNIQKIEYIIIYNIIIIRSLTMSEVIDTKDMENTQTLLKYISMTTEELKLKFHYFGTRGMEEKILEFGLNKLSNEMLKQTFPLIKCLIEEFERHGHIAAVKYEDYREKEIKRGGERSIYWGMVESYFADKFSVYNNLVKYIEKNETEKVTKIFDFIYTYYNDKRDIQMQAYGWRTDFDFYQKREKAQREILKL
jgi:hypothetical protein